MWRPIIDGRVWEAGVVTRAGFPLRSVAVELRDGGVCVVSPTRRLDPARLAEHAGDIRFLLAPNHFHYLGVPDWLSKSPRAVAVCAPTARPRLARKLDVAWDDLEALRAALPEDARLLVPEGTRNGEVWLVVRDTWIVCDAFFNLTSLPRGAAGLFCRVTQTGPGLRLGQTWKYLALRDRGAYARWLLHELTNAPPRRLVMAHGTILEGDDLAERLAALVRARLSQPALPRDTR